MNSHMITITSTAEGMILSKNVPVYARIVISTTVHPLHRCFMLVSETQQAGYDLELVAEDGKLFFFIDERRLDAFKLTKGVTYRVIKIKASQNVELYAIEEENGSFAMCNSPRMEV